ncbi:MAG: methyltransferase domain-containing protein [Desulfobacteraceae bacterium]|nr:methyltransferase domain-containing protein [Desulfobacteraceae bacterium]
MRTIEDCVVTAMDGSDSRLFPYLPYILQDIWQIGASPEVIVELIRKHANDYASLSILDLGCGKGAVSINIAKEFKCHCHGIDAIEAFIYEAQHKSKEYRVEKLCRFERGDIRTAISDLKKYNIIILGSIGPVFGNYYDTLTTLSKCLEQKGLIVIDDGYSRDGSHYSHPIMIKKSTILRQISDAGMRLIDEVILDPDEIKASDDFIIERIIQRCQELITKHPDKRHLFTDYIRNQVQENEVLETKVVCATMLIGEAS